MSLETTAAALAIWFFGSIPVALFVGRYLRLGSLRARRLVPTLPVAWPRHDEDVRLAS